MTPMLGSLGGVPFYLQNAWGETGIHWIAALGHVAIHPEGTAYLGCRQNIPWRKEQSSECWFWNVLYVEEGEWILQTMGDGQERESRTWQTAFCHLNDQGRMRGLAKGWGPRSAYLLPTCDWRTAFLHDTWEQFAPSASRSAEKAQMSK